MTGGDTAHFVCRTLGIHALLLQREFAPGVPLAIAEGGPFDGVSVVLKSGGFGEPDLLCRLLRDMPSGGTSLTAASTSREEASPRVAITLGDPAGVGAEVTLKALADPEIQRSARFIVLGDRAAVTPAERSSGIRLESLPVEFRDCCTLPADTVIAMGTLRAEYGARRRPLRARRHHDVPARRSRCHGHSTAQ